MTGTTTRDALRAIANEMRTRYAPATKHGASHGVIADNAVDVAACLLKWADRIDTALATPPAAVDGDEVERLRDQRRKWVSMSAEFEHRAEAAEAENERLREALRPFAAFPLEESRKFARREATITGFNDWTLRAGDIMDARDALLSTEARDDAAARRAQ